MMAAWATWKAVGVRSMPTTSGPDRSGTVGETAATGVMAACTGRGLSVRSGGAEPADRAAKTKGVMTTRPNAGVRVQCVHPLQRRCDGRADVPASPNAHSTVLRM